MVGRRKYLLAPIRLRSWLIAVTQYYQSIEPPDGAAIPSILPQALEPFLPVQA